MSTQNSDAVTKVSEEDFLEVDQPIPGQNFCCLSFVSPEKTLQQKETFLNAEFIKNFFKTKQEEVSKLKDAKEGMELFYKLAERQFNGNTEFTDTLKDLKNHMVRVQMNYDSVKNMYRTSYEDAERFYKDFKFNNEERLEKEFNEKNEFRTSTRGLKIRGTYDTLKEAQVRAEVLRRRDPNFNVFVAQVGYWVPWDPSAENIENQEYQEDHLNTIVKEYKANADKRDEHFQQDREEKKAQAATENVRKRKQLAELKAKQAKEDAEKTPAITIEQVNNDGTPANPPTENKPITESLKLPSSEESLAKVEELRKIVDDKNAIADSLQNDDPWMQRKKEQEAEQADTNELPDELPDNIELNSSNTTTTPTTSETTPESTPEQEAEQETEQETQTTEELATTEQELNQVADGIF